MIQQLRNAVVAPTGMGKNYGRIMPLLRQGWLVRQKIMHYGFFGQCFSGCLCSHEETSQLQPILLFLEDSLRHYNKTSNISISRFLIKVCLDYYNFCYLLVQELHNLRSTTHWSAKKLCNGKGGVPRLKCLKNGLRNCWIIPYWAGAS